jgi:hypothetical protein
MIKSIVLALAAVGGTLGAGAAHAGVSWSVGINAPLVGVAVGNAPVYRPAYRPYYQPAYVGPVYAPAPVYYPAPVAYYSPYRYYGAHPVAYPYRHGGWDYGYHGYRR